MNDIVKPSQDEGRIPYYYRKLREQTMEVIGEKGHHIAPTDVWDEEVNVSLIKKVALYKLVYEHDGKFYAVSAKYEFEEKMVDFQMAQTKLPMFPLNWPY